MESARVSRRFRTIFNCPDPTVRSTGDGYVARGCGVVAHFTCFDDDDDDYDPPDGATAGGAIFGAVIAGMLNGATDPDKCVLEHADRPQPPAPPEPAQLVQRGQEPAQGLVLKMRTLVQGGYLRALGRPADHPHHALLYVHTTQRLQPEPCEAELFRDGAVMPIQGRKRNGPYEVRILLRIEQLRDIHQTARFSGAVCGFEFDVAREGREALGVFYARFGEEAIRAQAAKSDQIAIATSSGGEAPAPSAGPAEAERVAAPSGRSPATGGATGEAEPDE